MSPYFIIEGENIMKNKEDCVCQRDLDKDYPLCKEKEEILFEEVSHYKMLMENIESKLSIPIEELYEFLIKAKEHYDLIEKKERKYEDGRE